MDCKINCLNCMYGELISGSFGGLYEPPELDEIVCNSPYAKEVAFEHDYEVWSSKCESFSPILIEKCKLCERVINMYKHEWENYAECSDFDGDDIPVCSEECVKSYNLANKLTDENIYFTFKKIC